MAAKSLQQILTELDSTYNPQIDLLRQKQSSIANSTSAEEAALKAQEQDYYDNTIMSSARQKGLGFSGIPIGERARYGATQFLPALARLKQQSKDQALSLEDAILQKQQERMQMGNQLYQQGIQNDQWQQQFDYQKQQDAMASARSGGGGGFGGFSFGGGTPSQPQQATTPTLTGKIELAGASPELIQQAFNNAKTFVDQGDEAAKSDYLATASSARYGNLRDLAKLRVYRLLRPDLFRSVYMWEGEALNKANNVGKGVLASRSNASNNLPLSNRVPTSNLLTAFGGQ